MLTKIIQLNSSLCSKAIISLDRDSIQLVGSNTIGKTSLINSLNLLFILASFATEPLAAHCREGDKGGQGVKSLLLTNDLSMI